MEEFTVLRDLVIILAVAVAVVSILRRFGVPSIAGFIVSGALIGPNALGFITDVHRVDLLAEVGVVLLLFGIGLELSLGRMRRLWRLIVFGGALQVGFTVAAVTGVAVLFGMEPGGAVFLGCVMAVSSTAIVLRGLGLRGELDAPHGRFTLGVLVFQDFCVVPMILLIPLLAGTSEGASILRTIGIAVGVLAAVFVASRLIVPRLLHLIARTRQRDLFVLAVFVICIGTAWAVSLVGISLALGAFLAGLVVAGSEYRHQALSDLIPFREVLTSVFFVSVGMLLDLDSVISSTGVVLGLLAAIVLGKFVVVWVSGAILGLPTRVNVLAGASLSQVGEFSFLLMSAARGTDLFSDTLATNLSVAVILSMLVTPLLMLLGPHLAAGAGKSRILTRQLGVRAADETPSGLREMSNHVIIAGYGLAGQELAHSLEDLGIPYVVIDLNAENVRRAIGLVVPAYFGDVTSPEVLHALGAANAKELVIVINDPGAAERAIKAARRVAPNLHIVVRAQYAADIMTMIDAGASEVITAEIEGSAEVTSRVLDRHMVRTDQIESERSRIRERTEEEES